MFAPINQVPLSLSRKTAPSAPICHASTSLRNRRTLPSFKTRSKPSFSTRFQNFKCSKHPLMACQGATQSGGLTDGLTLHLLMECPSKSFPSTVLLLVIDLPLFFFRVFKELAENNLLQIFEKLAFQREESRRQE